MRFFSSMHSPKTKWYTTYYSIVVVAASAVIIFTTLQFIHQNVLQTVMTFFEGFFSLFMLSRNEKVGKSFLSHLKNTLAFIRS